jgi:hypothetical protein
MNYGDFGFFGIYRNVRQGRPHLPTQLPTQNSFG